LDKLVADFKVYLHFDCCLKIDIEHIIDHSFIQDKLEFFRSLSIDEFARILSYFIDCY